MNLQTFGELIRNLRHKGGYTLTQLAAKLDMDSANLSKIETGKREFDDKRLPTLCSVFDLDLEEMQRELLSERFANKVYAASIDPYIFSMAEEKVMYLKAKEANQMKNKI